MYKYMFDDMPWQLKDALIEAANSQKREADAKALHAIADALKDHGTSEQYADSVSAIVELLDRMRDELDLNSAK